MIPMPDTNQFTQPTIGGGSRPTAGRDSAARSNSPGKVPEPPPAVVTVTPARQLGQSSPLTVDELWQLVQSKRGFESSPSRYKSDKGDELRRSPATISWDA